MMTSGPRDLTIYIGSLAVLCACLNGCVGVSDRRRVQRVERAPGIHEPAAPAAVRTPPAVAGVGLHVGEPSLHFIKSGDTLYAVAERYGTTVRALQKLNPGLSSASLRVGDSIVLPAGKPRIRAIQSR